jgi:hypothetical protein
MAATVPAAAAGSHRFASRSGRARAGQPRASSDALLTRVLAMRKPLIRVSRGSAHADSSPSMPRCGRCRVDALCHDGRDPAHRHPLSREVVHRCVGASVPERQVVCIGATPPSSASGTWRRAWCNPRRHPARAQRRRRGRTGRARAEDRLWRPRRSLREPRRYHQAWCDAAFASRGVLPPTIPQ